MIREALVKKINKLIIRVTKQLNIAW